MKYLFYLVCFFFLPLFIKGQQPVNVTNVDLDYLRPKWMGANLNSLTFRNGDSIKVAKNFDQWKTLNSTGKTNESTVYIKKTDSGYEYYYNYYAIKDQRNIIPLGYRLPNKSDFTTDIDFSLSNRGKTFENSSILHIAPYGSIAWKDGEKKFGFFPHDENSLYLWTSDPSTTTDYWGTEYIKIEINRVEARPSQSLRTSGYVIRCIEDNDNEIKNKLHEYKFLLPNNFTLLKSSIEKKLSTDCKIKFGDKLILKIEVSFDQNGRNTSRILDFSPKKGTDNIINLIDSIIKNNTVAPYYHGFSLKARTEFTIEFVRTKPVEEKKQTAINPSKQSKNKISTSDINQPSYFTGYSKLKETGFLRDKPDATGNVLRLIQANEEVEVLYQSKKLNGYLYVRYKGVVGYVNDIFMIGDNNQISSNIENTEVVPAKKQPSNKQVSANKDKRVAKGRKINDRETEKYHRQQTRLRNRQIRQDKKNERQADYVINNRTVIKNYIGVSLGTTHPILGFANTKQFSGTNHSGFAKTGFSASLDSYIRIKNGVGVKIKADVLSFSFDTWNYERNNMYPTYTIQDKKNGFITPHYYLIQNLMAGFSFNIGKYKLLFETSILGGITTGINPTIKYSGYSVGSSMKSNQNVFVGVGYQLAGAFRIRCTSTFSIKIGATYMQSIIPQYTNPVPDSYGRFNKGTLTITSISPQISFVGMFFRPK